MLSAPCYKGVVAAGVLLLPMSHCHQPLASEPPLSTSRLVLHCPEEPSHNQLPANIPRDISLQQTQPETPCSPAGKAGPLALLLTLKSLPHHPAPLCESVPTLRMMKTILHLSGDCLCAPETAGCMLSPCKYASSSLSWLLRAHAVSRHQHCSELEQQTRGEEHACTLVWCLQG